MAFAPRFGLVIPQLVPFPAMIERFQTAERLGFDSAWVVDHFVNPARHTGRWFECWTMLAAMACHTTRVQLGTLVTSISYRNPALLAKEALTVDHISGGRLIVGLGAAGQPQDHTMTGSEPWTARERVDRFAEFVAVVDQLLREEVSSFDGRFYCVRDAIMAPGPLQRPRPPLLIAAHGPRALRIAAAHADIWNSIPGPGLAGRTADLSPSAALEAMRQRNARLSELASAAGRDPASIRRSLLAGGGAGPDTPWSSVGAFHDFVGRYRAAGIDEFLFYYPSREERSFGRFERIATEEIPKIRSLPLPSAPRTASA